MTKPHPANHNHPDPDTATTPGSDVDTGSRLHRAFRLCAGDLERPDPTPFHDPSARRPGRIDRRVILQDNIWVDYDTRVHHLKNMSASHRTAVLAHLNRQETPWVQAASKASMLEAIAGFISPHEAVEHFTLLGLLTPGWSAHTPLGRKLLDLNGTHPVPLDAPAVLKTAAQSDHPDVLDDTDHGTWRITTLSGATYLIDLDTRRILRAPAPPADSTASTTSTHPEPPDLTSDGQWANLTHLLRCQIHNSLLALDHTRRNGWRVSTPITTINRVFGGDAV